MKRFIFSPEDIKYSHNQNPERYICNQSVNPTPDKMTRIIGNVTCKNCINILMNRTLVVTEYRG